MRPRSAAWVPAKIRSPLFTFDFPTFQLHVPIVVSATPASYFLPVSDEISAAVSREHRSPGTATAAPPVAAALGAAAVSPAAELAAGDAPGTLDAAVAGW